MRADWIYHNIWQWFSLINLNSIKLNTQLTILVGSEVSIPTYEAMIQTSPAAHLVQSILSLMQGTEKKKAI